MIYVTEDTTRSDPSRCAALFTTAIRAGATRLCLSDTVGHATPDGARSVVQFAKSVVAELRRRTSASTGTATTIAASASVKHRALESGATRLHGAALGIGERVGNAPMDLLLLNLVLMGYLERDLTALPAYCRRCRRPATCRSRPTTRSSAPTRSARRPACTQRR